MKSTLWWARGGWWLVLSCVGLAWPVLAQSEAAKPSTYGRTLLGTYEMPAELVARYNDEAAPKPVPPGEKRPPMAPDWHGPEFAAKSDMPYTMVVKLKGTVTSEGDVVSNWQPFWNDRGPVLISLFKHRAKAGETVLLEAGSAPVRFKLDQPTTPTLTFRSAEHLHLDRVTVEVWSGIGQSNGIQSLMAWSPLWVGLVFLALVVWVRRR